ncbi:hypothetical protein [Aeromonas veronii]|uniref:hypothetical protein n=1 Tax=Aeromonas veronii TaxID=654 RepID=UPI003B9E2C07
MNTMPVVNVFNEPYEIWEEREPTCQEMMNGFFGPQKTRIIETIYTHYQAAEYELLNRGCTKLDDHISRVLNNSSEFSKMRRMMPSITDKILSDFQNSFQSTSFDKVSEIVDRDGKILSEGQILYHGGFYNGKVDETFVTTRPLSTSFSPHMACQNAEWRGKAYDVGALHLIILRVVTPQTNAFCFKINGTNKGHEKEVLFSKGAKLTLRAKHEIKKDGMVYKGCHINPGRVLEKTIPFYILEIDIS